MLRLSSCVGLDFDLRDGVVAVRVLADAVVVEQAVAVAEVDALGHGIHACEGYQMPRPSAVLLSGGLDSAVLVAEEAARGDSDVQPVYVSVGLAWERAERRVVERLLALPERSGLACGRSPRSRWTCATSIRATHWAIEGRRPATTRRTRTCTCRAATSCCSERRACTAPRRASIGSCSARSITIRSRTRRRRSARRWPRRCRSAWRIALTIEAPYATLSKADVIRRGARSRVPLELTLSCMNPAERDSSHCGVCSKCRERHDAFLEAGVADPTSYADRQFVRSAGR